MDGAGFCSPRLRALLLPIIFLSLGASLIWMSLGDHALHGRSEGRYASVSAAMARGGDWMAPEFLGQPHLTKPPMVYWLEAESMLWFGQNEFAVRFPAASGR